MRQISDYKGKWVVLYFYPKDQTPGCTTQACEFRDDIFAFRKAGAQILGVSVDDAASHKEFAEKHGLPFPLLADPTYATAKRYGVLAKFGPMTIASRDTFLIDPNGKIAKHYDVTPDKLAGHSKEVLGDIAALKAAATKG
jgi:peroxiredoxin Q/BCP